MEIDLGKRIEVAAGRKKADLVIKNGKIIDVFNADIINGDVAIVDGFIAGVGKYSGEREIDADGCYISPGLIDGHVHIESSMVTPQEFAKALLIHGVTSVISDPHEIANVAGKKGIQYMLESSKDLPVDIFIMLPSSVPAADFEHAGASLESEDLKPFYQEPRVLGLAEVMNFPGVKNADKKMLAKIKEAKKAGKRIDGHAAGLSADDLNVYMASGIRTDHECTTVMEARERLQKGMYLMIREGTVAKDLKNVIGAVNQQNSRRCLFVTDDKHLDDIMDEGSIDFNVKLAIQSGISPITAIQMATFNAAECYGLTNKGAVAPGYEADLLLIENLTEMSISTVFKSGREVVANSRLLPNHLADSTTDIAHLSETVSFPELETTLLNLPLKGRKANLIGIIPNSLVTHHIVEEVEVDEDGMFEPSIEKDQLKVALIERHKMTGHIGLGIVKGLGLKSGAIASTVAHDSHNLVLCGTNDQDMILAANEIKKMQGGLIVVKNGYVLARLELPIAGLMSPLSYQEVYSKLKVIDKALEQLGANKNFNPFLTLSFLALPVIPEVKLTVQGLFHAGTFLHIGTDAEDAS